MKRGDEQYFAVDQIDAYLKDWTLGDRILFRISLIKNKHKSFLISEQIFCGLFFEKAGVGLGERISNIH